MTQQCECQQNKTSHFVCLLKKKVCISSLFCVRKHRGVSNWSLPIYKPLNRIEKAHQAKLSSYSHNSALFIGMQMERDDEQAAISPYEQRLEKCSWYEGLEAQCQTWWLFFVALWQRIFVTLRLSWRSEKLSCRHVCAGSVV